LGRKTYERKENARRETEPLIAFEMGKKWRLIVAAAEVVV